MALELGGRVEGAEVGEFGRSRADACASPAGCWRACRHEQSCWMSHRDTVFEPPPGLHRAGVVDRVAGRGARGRRARPLRDPVPPRGRAHAVRHATILTTLPARRLRLRRWRGRAASVIDEQVARDPRAGRRRPRDLRAVRRRRLVGGRAARAPGARRPAHLRVRRPRPDAQERGRAGGRRVPRPLPGAARRTSTRRSASSRGSPGVTDPEQKRKIIGEEFIRVFEEEAAKLGDADATSCRARSTRT